MVGSIPPKSWLSGAIFALQISKVKYHPHGTLHCQSLVPVAVHSVLAKYRDVRKDVPSRRRKGSLNPTLRDPDPKATLN